MKKIKLFCFPYAGGSATVYAKWKDLLYHSIELIPVELRGRGHRITQPHYQNLDDTLNDVFNIIKNEIKSSHYAFFGHSLGTLIAYELYWKIKSNLLPLPIHTFFSGRGALHVPRSKERKIFHLLPDNEFRKEVIELGGTPKDFFNYPELIEILLPILRNDFMISETYSFPQYHGDTITPMEHGLTILLGKEETLSAEHAFGWRLHTNKLCSVHYFEGGHFFLHEHTGKIVEIVNNILVTR